MKRNKQKALAFSLVAALLCSCGQSATTTDSATGDSQAATPAAASTSGESFSVVTTIFPEYDWTRELIGDNQNAELSLLMNSGVDLHSYAPTADDIILISTCDLFVYTGGVSYSWVADVLAQAENPDMVVINLMEQLGDRALMEVHVDGMQVDDHDHDHEEEEHDHDHEEEEHDHEEEEHDHDHEEEEHDHDHEEEEHDHDHEEEEHDHDHAEEETATESHAHNHEDEHVWMSLQNASFLSGLIADGLSQVDPDNSDSYQENLGTYQAALAAMDQNYADTIAAASTKTFLVADRFPFLYMAIDYDLDYFAAFSGCSSETEASFETILFLSDKVEELGLKYVITTETGNDIANTVVQATSSKDQEILTLDSMQSTTTASGDTYLGVMETNLQVLATAFG